MFLPLIRICSSRRAHAGIALCGILFFLHVHAPAAETHRRESAEFLAAMEAATKAYNRKDYAAAEVKLNEADQLTPNSSIAANLRGAIHLDRKEWDEAEKCFREAIRINPRFFYPQFNLINIPYHQKKYAEARAQLEALRKKWPKEELIPYKIFLTLLLEKNDEAASAQLEKIKFPGDTPAYYYAHAAWDFSHGAEKESESWLQAARWIFNPYLISVFNESLSEVGLLKSPESNAPAN